MTMYVCTKSSLDDSALRSIVVGVVCKEPSTSKMANNMQIVTYETFLASSNGKDLEGKWGKHQTLLWNNQKNSASRIVIAIY